MANLYRGFSAFVTGKRAFQPIDKTATANVSVTPTLTGVGFGNNYSTLSQSVTPALAATGSVFPIKGTLAKQVVLTSTTAADVVRVGALSVSVAPTLTGAGAYGQNATFSRQLILTSTTYGSPENKGTLDRSIQPGFVLTSTAAAKVSPTRGTLAEQIAVTLTAAGGTTSVTATLAKTLVLTSTTAETRLPKLLMGLDVAPAMTISSTTLNTPPNENTLPAFTNSATMLNGRVASVALTLPKFTATGDDGLDTDTTLPAFTNTATLTPGRIISTAVTLPKPTMSATLAGPIVLTGANDLPSLRISARMTNAGATLSASTLPSLTSAATLLPGNAATVTVLLPAFTSAGSLAEIPTISSTESLPAFYSVSQIHNGASVTYNPFTMNTENYGVTQYSNYDFHTVFARNGKYYGANATGIYELDGANDAGTSIPANFKLGISDFGNSGLKRTPAVYLGYVGGDLTIDVRVDGQTTVKQYTIGQISHTSGIKRGRAKPGRGLKSRYWQFGASNVNGSDFEIDTLGVYVQQYDRKAQ